MVKVTFVNRAGAESQPVALSDNGNGYVCLPTQAINAVQCKLYLPLHGFEVTGPWYLWRTLRPREVKQCRRTVAISYLDSDLIPALSPNEMRTCVLCGDEHQVVTTYFGSELLACPKAKDNTIYYVTRDDSVLDAEVILDDILDADIVG